MEDEKQIPTSEIKIALEYSHNIIATLREPFLVLDKKLRIISVNQAFYDTFKVEEKDTIGRPLPDLGNGQWNIPGLLLLLKEILPEKKTVKDYEVRHQFEHIGQRCMNINVRQLNVHKKIVRLLATTIAWEEQEEDAEELILMAIEDITERKILEELLSVSEERYRRMFETSQDGLLVVHKTQGDILNANEAAQELLGYSHEEFLRNKLWMIGVTHNEGDFKETALRLEKDGTIHFKEIPVKTKLGLDIITETFLTDKAKTIQCNIRDITKRKNLDVMFHKHMKELEVFYKASFAREGRIVELKKEIRDLKKDADDQLVDRSTQDK